jgi:hypothetical protein
MSHKAGGERPRKALRDVQSRVRMPVREPVWLPVPVPMDGEAPAQLDVTTFWSRELASTRPSFDVDGLATDQVPMK